MTLTGFAFLLPIEERLRINALTGNVEYKNVLCLLRYLARCYKLKKWTIALYID